METIPKHQNKDDIDSSSIQLMASFLSVPRFCQYSSERVSTPNFGPVLLNSYSWTTWDTEDHLLTAKGNVLIAKDPFFLSYIPQIGSNKFESLPIPVFA